MSPHPRVESLLQDGGAHRSQQVTSPFRPADALMIVASRFGLAEGDNLRITRVIIVAVIIAWAPILLLATLDGTAWDTPNAIPLLSDFVPYGRCFGALPLILLFIHFVHRRTALAFEHLENAGLIDTQERNNFEEILTRARRLIASPVVLSVTLLMTVSMTVTGAFVNREIEVESWTWNTRGELSNAGLWYYVVSTPLIRFLLLRAIWTYIVWAWVLLKLAGLRLRLNALHPDQSCGLLFLGDAQLAFTPVLAAMGVQLGCGVADAVFYTGVALASFKWVGVAFLCFGLVGFVLPLIAFTTKMWFAREEAEYAFDAWASGAARYLNEKMLDPRREASATLSMPEISAMTDAASLYDRTSSTRLMPLNRTHIVLVLLVAGGSVLLPLVALLPLQDISRHLVEMIL